MEHLKIVEVKKAAWSSTVRTTGTVDWDADHTTQAITQVSGPISRLLVDTGDGGEGRSAAAVRVQSGRRECRSPLTGRRATVWTMPSERWTASQDLLDHKVIAMKDLEAAQQDYNDAGSDVDNSLQALKIFGVTQQEMDEAQHQGVAINPQLAVRSPIAGVVVQKLVSPGLVIQAGTTACFTISDVSTVWVQGHIYDRDLESIRVGDAVEETNSSFQQTFHGTVSYIGAMVDPATRTTSVRIVTRNPEGMLKKDMFVDAVIHTRSGRSVLTVPTSAILRNDENSAVRVRAGRAGTIRAEAGEPGRAARRRHGDRERSQGGRKDCRRRQCLSSVCQ